MPVLSQVIPYTFTLLSLCKARLCPFNENFILLEALAVEESGVVDKDNWRSNPEPEQLKPPKSYIITDAHEERTKVLLFNGETVHQDSGAPCTPGSKGSLYTVNQDPGAPSILYTRIQGLPVCTLYSNDQITKGLGSGTHPFNLYIRKKLCMKKLIGSIIGIFLIRYVLLPGVQIQMKVVIIPTWFLLQMMDLSDFGGTSFLMR